MKHLLIVVALLVSATSFGQKAKSTPKNAPEKATHGSTISDVAKSTQDGQTVSGVASSKSKAYKYGRTDDRKKIKAAKIRKATVNKGKARKTTK